MPQLTFKGLSPRLTGWFARSQDDPGSNSSPSALDLGVTPEAVAWAYRLLLDREPEGPQAVRKHIASLSSFGELRNRILNSAEYRKNNQPLHVPALTGVEPPLVIEDVLDPSELSRLLDHIGQTWQQLGEIEPHWSVITADRFHSANIKENEVEFYQSGEDPANRLFKTLRRNGVDPTQLRTCLEYGCGLGRVTGWLARRFEHVFGYDISSAHLEGASSQLAARGITNVTLRQIRTVDDIHNLERVDLVYSLIVLQHNPPPVIRIILREFLCAAKPGGFVLFQVPTYRSGYRFTAASYLARDANIHSQMEMHVIPQREVFAIVHEEGGEMLEVIEDGWTSPRPGEVSNTFLVRKPV